jgi:hypothetical protein
LYRPHRLVDNLPTQVLELRLNSWLSLKVTEREGWHPRTEEIPFVLIRRLSTVSICLAFTASLGFASRSPTIIVNGDPPGTFTNLTSESFGFGADPLGGGDYGFINSSGANWVQLDVFVSLPTPQAISCGSDVFSTCTWALISSTGSVFTYDITFGPNPAGGVAQGGRFTIDLDNEGTAANGGGLWGPGTDLDAVANIPEPSSAAFGTLGLALMLAYYFFGVKPKSAN